MDFLIVLLSGVLIGWLLDFFYKLFDRKKIILPRFINVQMYALTGIFCYFLSLVHPSFFFVLPAIFVFTTGIEFLTGYIYLNIFGSIPWDYSRYRYNFKKIVCLNFSLCWLLVGLIYYYYILPILLNFSF